MQPSQGASRPDKPCSGAIIVTRHCPVEMRRPSWRIDQFVVAKKLGGGYASTVHLAICKATGTQVAIKVYHRCKLSQLNNYQVQREIRIHSCLDHKHVLQLYAAFEDEVGIYLVTEYASRGDVFGELDRRGGSMTEADAVRQVLAPFLSALEYLHMLNIIHRDIKPENLLFTAAGMLKVADFGLSIDITQERPVTRVGTLDYMAPEVVICPDKCHPSDHKEKTHLHYTYLVDAWAVGVLAYELTVGRAPFDAGHKRGTIENILHSQPRFPAWISDSCRHFVSWSLTKDTAKRPGIQQLAEHPWIHQHAGITRPSKMPNPGRAVSFHNLSMYTDPTIRGAAAAAEHRHKVGEGLAGSKSSSERLADLEEEDEEEVFVSASGEPAAAAAAVCMEAAPAQQAHAAPPAAMARLPSFSSSKQPAVPGSAVVINATSGSAAAALSGHAGATVTTPSVVSPFAAPAAQATPAAPASSSPSTLMGLPMLGAAADKLRAFVHRCQSANDIEALKAFMLLQPPEPSNACFEPGGRFYSGPAPGSAAGTGSAAASSQQQQHHSHQPAATAGKHGISAHDSAASLGSHCSSSSSSSSRPAELPRVLSSGLNNSSSPFPPPKPLQLVKIPSSLAAATVPRSDSCRSLQGLAGISEGKAEGKDSSTGGGPAGVQHSLSGSLQGAASTSPMAVSPAAPSTTGAQHGQKSGGRGVFDSPRAAGSPHGFSGTDHAGSPSTSSCSCSCSSSCESGMNAGSVSSNHSWGYQQQQDGQQQQQQQHSPHSPPQPPSPMCHQARGGSPSAKHPFGTCQDSPLALTMADCGAAAAGHAKAAAVAVGVHRNPSCHELEQLINICRPASSTVSGSGAAAAGNASKRAGVPGLAGGPLADAAQQQQQLAGLGQNNGCFGFLKSPRR